jgi:ribosome-binding protein aMBF1 (putative translation factor)
MSESKCPVCGWALDANAQQVQVNGRELAVCCDECAAQLKSAPNGILVGFSRAAPSRM